MSEIETAIVVLCGLFGWVALLHHRLSNLRDECMCHLHDLNAVKAHVNRLQKEVREK